MAVANQIQQRLMPAEPLRLAEYEVCGWNRPASTTGGDYYDWMPLDAHRLVVAIADVTGHGIGPALLMAVCRAYARATLPGQLQLDDGMRRLNTLLSGDLAGERFITFAAAIVDQRTHEVELLSAGHGPILLCHLANNHVDVFGGNGLPLGIMEDPLFDPPRRIRFNPGDMLLLVTDGFTEAAHPQTGEMYGIDRLRGFIQANRDLPGPTLLVRLAGDVADFTAGAAQADDMTAVLIHRTPPPSD
jgi:serine phosphatase RsbU (regulator of sigma subunit)